MTALALKIIAQHFLAGGGEMGASMRAYDWSRGPLGPPESWPQSLKTAIGIMLRSRQPIWIGWGDELTYFYNDAYKSIIGGKHPWALGRPTKTVWSEIWYDIEPMLSTAMSGAEGTYVENQLLIMERNGYEEETYYTFSYSPIPDDDGGTGGIICANTDDTGRVIGERQLALLKELAARTADARSWQEACGRAADALGCNRRDIPFGLIYIGEPGGKLLSLASASGIAKGHRFAPSTIPWEGGEIWPIGDCLRGNEARLISREALPKDGELPEGEWHRPPDQVAAIPIPFAGDKGRGGVMIAGLSPYRLFDRGYRDFLGLAAGQIAKAISNAEAYEDERRRAEALAEIDQAKTAFFTNISHEFRTPLTLMLGPLEDLKEEFHRLPLASESASLQLDLAYRNGLRLLKLVNTLLDFSRIEAGRMRAEFDEIDLSAFTAELASVYRSAIEKAGLRLIVDCPPLAERAFVDGDMWEKIVLNLVSNAFKFTFEGEIEVKLRKSGKQFELSIRDTGIGIPREELPRVFERFHRIPSMQGRSQEGAGIGLALVDELVRLHGGTLSADSVEGQGSTFSVLIPAETRSSPRSEVRASRSPTLDGMRYFAEEALRWLPNGGTDTAEMGALATATGPRPRIVLADDNADMRAYVARLLRNKFDVEEAADGVQALEAIHRKTPDLVISDVMMPRLDGFALLRELRFNALTKALPVIVLSARAGEEATVEGIEAGADDYLVKPFSARELIARVSSTLDLARVRREAAERERHLRQEAETARERLVNALTGIDELFMVFDHEWRLLYVNDRTTELTGKAREELLGGCLWELFPEIIGTEFQRIALESAAKRKTGHFSFNEPYGRWFDVRLYPSTEGVTLVAADITEARRASARTLGQKHVLEMVASGKPLQDTLDALLLFIESQETGMRSSILLAIEDGLYFRRVSSPSMTPEFCKGFDEAIAGVPNKPPYFAPCAEIANRHAPILVSDLAEETRYAPAWRNLLIAGGFLACLSKPIFGTDGRFLGSLAMYFDRPRDPDPVDTQLVDIGAHLAAIAIERNRAEMALRESEATLRAFYDSAPVFMGIVETTSDGDLLHIYDNPRSCKYLAVEPGATAGKLSIADLKANPVIVKQWYDHFQLSQKTGQPERFEHPFEANGQTRWLAATVCTLGRSPSGRMRFCYVADDVTGRKRAEIKQSLLTNELNHRVKNTLAVVQAIAGQTARYTPEPNAFKKAFEGRIAALSRVHDLLTRASWTGTSLEALAAASVAPFNQGGAIRLKGPHIELEPEPAVTLSLAFNELATNAAKYGALVAPSGFVALDWASEGNPNAVSLIWKEHGGPEVRQPSHRGFGSLLIERLASQLGGTVALEYLADGLRCTLDLPLTRGKLV